MPPALRTAGIERILANNGAAVAEYFAAGPDRPCLFEDAVSDWPALGKWSLAYFASHYGDEIGLTQLDFRNEHAGKVTKLGTFIAHLDDPFSAIPGFWTGQDGKPTIDEPEYDEGTVWSFVFEPFKKHRELLDDISPFPPAIPNLTASLPYELYRALEIICLREFRSIYLSRQGTVTPLHRDFYHTFGCLVQFVGTKQVTLFAPSEGPSEDDPAFDIEAPDFDRHPEMRDSLALTTVLRPGEMLIIPPDWWHGVRSLEHSITLSHNFFNAHNFAAHMTSVLGALCERQGEAGYFDAIARALKLSQRSA